MRMIMPRFDIGKSLHFPRAVHPYEPIGADAGGSERSIDKDPVPGHVELAEGISTCRRGKEIVQNRDRRAGGLQFLEVEGHRPEAVILRIEQMAGANV